MPGPLEYQRVGSAVTPPPPANNRPSRITLIGTMSVLLGVVGMISAIAWTGWTCWIYSRSGFTATSTVVITSAPGKPAYTPTPNKEKVAEQLQELQPINSDRLHLLDALLENAPKLHLLHKAQITDHGRLPSASGEKPQYFEFSGGRIELYDTHAIFRPTSGTTVRVSADDIVDTRFASGLTPADLKVLMQQVREKAGDGLSSQQEQAIKSLLQAGSQKLVMPAISMEGQITAVEIDGAEATLRTTNGWVTLKSDGTLAGSGRGAGSGAGSRSVTFLSAAAACGGGVISFVLALALFILGIATLGQKLWVRKWLIVYACIKIVVAIFGVVMLSWVWSSFLGGLKHDSASIWLILAWSLAVVFPVCLLVLLNRGDVKDYYLKADPFYAG